MRYVFFLLGLLAAANAHAVKLSCREDRDTRATACYDPKAVRSNGQLRAFPLFMGGPKGVEPTNHTAVVNCRAGYLELRDRRGVVFARNTPEKRFVRNLVEDVCAEQKTKPDKTLD